MPSSEFDAFAEDYLKAHAENTKLTGEDPEYFARYKIVEIYRQLKARGDELPKSILDFGTGIGNSLPHLKDIFPDATVTGLDVSEKSLSVAAARFPNVANLKLYNGTDLPFEAGTFDLVFSSCVFHHIDARAHVRLFSGLRQLLTPNGRMVIFEHNPINPVTRYIVATCPFDENAVLISAGELQRRQLEAGFGKVGVHFTGFFPGKLAALRPLEPWMSALPIGAQYYTWARSPRA